MSVTSVRCPNCGSVASKSINHDEYKCSHCGATFYFTKPNVQKYDAVSHNCPLCGKPIPPDLVTGVGDVQNMIYVTIASVE